MYEPIRTKSVHSTPAASDLPHRSRDEELDLQLAGHLAALLAVTDELRGPAADPELDAAAERLSAEVARLRGGHAPVRAAAGAAGDPAPLHRRAHMLAGRALVVAASRADTAAAILAAERMDAHSPERTGQETTPAAPRELSAAR
ncbi:SCO4983 family protein [Streptomyces sp. NPDC001091]